MMWMFKMNWGVKMKWLVVLCFFVAVSTWSEYCMIVGQGECIFVSCLSLGYLVCFFGDGTCVKLSIILVCWISDLE